MYHFIYYFIEAEQGEEYAEILNAANKQDQRMCTLFRTCFLLAWALNSVLPLVRMGLSYWLAGHAEPELPFPCLYVQMIYMIYGDQVIRLCS